MKPCISIVVPAYNLEGIIGKTLEALASQDYPDFEIILVNDSSTDNTVCEARLALEKAKIKYKIISHEVNRGVAAARNTGMDAVETKLFLFFDGDDRCDNDLLTLLYDAAVSGGNELSDITVCGQRRFFVKENKIIQEPIQNALDIAKMTGEAAAAARILNKFEPSIASLYRTDFLKQNDLRFYEGCTAGEDGEFVLKALTCARKISAVSGTPYIYMVHPRMGSKDYNREKRVKRYEDNANGMLRCCRFIKEKAHDERLIKLVDYQLFPDTMLRIISAAAMHNDKGSYKKLIKETDHRIFWNSWHVLTRKPEFFLKGILVVAMPCIYYNYYRKKRP